MTDDQKWTPCPSGTLREIADRQQQAASSGTMTRRGLFAAVITAGAGLGVTLWNRTQSATTQLTCQQTRELAREYVDGQLSEQTSAMVRAHCSYCPPCADHVEELTVAKSVS